LFFFFFSQDNKSVTLITNYPGQSSARYSSRSKTRLFLLLTPARVPNPVSLTLLVGFPLATRRIVAQHNPGDCKNLNTEIAFPEV